MRAHPHLVAGTGRLDTDLGRGSTFAFTLPLVRESDQV